MGAVEPRDREVRVGEVPAKCTEKKGFARLSLLVAGRKGRAVGPKTVPAGRNATRRIRMATGFILNKTLEFKMEIPVETVTILQAATL